MGVTADGIWIPSVLITQVLPSTPKQLHRFDADSQELEYFKSFTVSNSYLAAYQLKGVGGEALQQAGDAHGLKGTFWVINTKSSWAEYLRKQNKASEDFQLTFAIL